MAESKHAKNQRERNHAAEEALRYGGGEPLSLLEWLTVLPFMLVGKIFFWMIILEKKTPRKNFGNHAKAVKEAGRSNREQLARQRAEEEQRAR